MGAARDDLLRAGRANRLGGGADRAGGVDDVVDDDGDAAADVTDDVHLGDLVGGGAALVDDGEGGIQALGEGAGTLDAAGIGRHHRHASPSMTCSRM